MKQHRFGPSGREVPIIGQGTWEIDRANRKVVIAALRAGLDLGMTHIDTAEMYGSGASEEIIAAAIAGRREEVFLVSKVLPSNASRAGTIAACERSLARLRTDHLECYLLHWRGRYPLEETIAGFEQLRGAGKILSWGVSNFDVEDLEEAWRIAPGQIACDQVLYHLQERAAEHAVIPWCEEHRVAVVGYSPFGHSRGFPGPRSSEGRVLAEIAAAHGVTARQVALRFLTRRASLFAIPKASSSAHVEENAGAGELALSDAEITVIERAFPKGRARALPVL
jgi:diketogulonate reductase-like aldo/keto reductase